jgi:rubrerythrin
MTSSASFISKSIEIERKTAELYAEFARRFAGDSEAAELFSCLADEEQAHAKSLEFVDRVLRGFKGRLEVTALFDEVADALLRDLGRALQLLRDGKPISVETAVSLATKIEASMIEEQRVGLIETDSVELLKTFKMLSSQTDGHKERLRAFAEGRKPQAV